jgi:hypothetical protein
MQKTTTPISSIRKVADGASTGAGTTNSNKINAGGYGTAKAFLNITAASGTSPTLDIKFQDSYDGTNWVDVASGAFAQKTAANYSSLVLTNVGPYLRAVQTRGGTSPSFTYDLYVAGVN